MTEAAGTPEGDPRIGPDGPPPTDFESAVGNISGFLHPEAEEATPDEPAQEAEEPAQEAQEAPATEDAPAEAEAETEEAELTSVDELPDTLSSLAEQIGVTEEELASHIKIPAGKDEQGNVTHVTVAEAMRGNLRQADYTQKTMALAEERKAFDEGVKAAQSEWQNRFTQIDDLATQLESQLQQVSDDDLNRLIDEDPQEYLRLSAQRDHQQRALAMAQEIRQQKEESQAKEFEASRAKFRQDQQRALLEKLPEMSDTSKRTAFESGIVEAFTSVGFSEQEVKEYMSGPFDHRVVLLADMARQYANAKKGTQTLAKKVKGLPKVVKPNAAEIKTKGDETADVRNRMRRTGSVDDAANFVRGLLKQ